MVIVSHFKWARCVSNVGFFLLVVFSRYCGLVHNAFGLTITLPIGIFSSLGLLVIEYGSVVRQFNVHRDDIVHVGNTAVA